MSDSNFVLREFRLYIKGLIDHLQLFPVVYESREVSSRFFFVEDRAVNNTFFCCFFSQKLSITTTMAGVNLNKIQNTGFYDFIRNNRSDLIQAEVMIRTVKHFDFILTPLFHSFSHWRDIFCKSLAGMTFSPCFIFTSLFAPCFFLLFFFLSQSNTCTCCVLTHPQHTYEPRSHISPWTFGPLGSQLGASAVRLILTGRVTTRSVPRLWSVHLGAT